MASAKKPVDDKAAAAKAAADAKTAAAKRKAAVKVEKAKRPVTLQSGVTLTREEAARHAALHKPKPSPAVKL